MAEHVKRYITSFGRFWWDFLVGDTPELFVGMLAIVGLAYALHHHHVIAVIVVPAVTVVGLGLSIYRGRKRAT